MAKYVVGDILIGGSGQRYITQGAEYEVYVVDSDGTAWIEDDDGDSFSTDDGYFKLKETVNPARISIESTTEDTTTGLRLITLEVDEAGAEAIADLIKKTGKARVKSEIRAQIASLEAQLQDL